MFTRNRIKEIKSLEQKKYRKRMGLFVAEGPKLVLDLLGTFEPVYILVTPRWLNQHPGVLPQGVETDIVPQEELTRSSLQQHPQDILCLFRIPHFEAIMAEEARHSLVLALDGVQDPGNLGTIVRLADWFGIRDVFCSPLTADIYSPKAVQATMGALARVRVHYTNLAEALQGFQGPVFGTFLGGEDIYRSELTQQGVIVMGNEGNGIGAEMAERVTHRLFIPPFPADVPTSESLNVAMATAITLSEFRRR
ncbi:MAG: RNA methyltransferase [Bacteroidaceae bacterium]|nr:RNA methyltransferase [Prevotellaceae bacterium]MDY5631011.1 RNA methyltransferase [Bacteroidaceae bacterium]